MAPGERNLKSMLQHIESATNWLQQLDDERSAARKLFMLFYYLVDGHSVRKIDDRLVVNVDLVRNIADSMHRAVEFKTPASSQGSPAKVFADFWERLTSLTPPNEWPVLAGSFRRMADSTVIKYEAIDDGVTMPLDRFIQVRRHVPVMTFLSVERALRGIPVSTSGEDAVLAGLVADYIGWTNDLFSAKREIEENFNLVLVGREAWQLPMDKAADRVVGMLEERRREYARRTGDLGRFSELTASGVVPFYDELIHAATQIYRSSEWYRAAKEIPDAIVRPPR
ncbi:terpene synthase family protein [Saccharopolyspora sp. ASAGF58]|uniref:terpene synthase family protein n=1 Tax=Saccharopolyspora sp. ASAGF58 TaxID=2719023 RepID=UPI001448627B|nr:terpene synthase family protein [Saccharopolyspora sp. ASAGF58]